MEKFPCQSCLSTLEVETLKDNLSQFSYLKTLWVGKGEKCLFSTYFMTGTEKAMAPHSSTLAWKIPWAEEPGRLQSMGSLRVGHD